jgi:hypothetical protein
MVHTSRVRSRSVVPLTLVGGLTVVALVAAIVGARSAPNAGTVVANDPEAAAQLEVIVARTIDAASFTQIVTISGKGSPGPEPEYLVYNAPNRIELYYSTTHHLELIDVGNVEYSLDAVGVGWTKMTLPTAETGRAVAIGILDALERGSSVSRVSGSSFAVTTSDDDRPQAITGIVRVKGAYVSDVRFTEQTPRLTYDFRFARIDASPHVTPPANAHPSSASCVQGIAHCAVGSSSSAGSAQR